MQKNQSTLSTALTNQGNRIFCNLCPQNYDPRISVQPGEPFPARGTQLSVLLCCPVYWGWVDTDSRLPVPLCSTGWNKSSPMGINLHNNYSVFSVQLFPPSTHMCTTAEWWNFHGTFRLSAGGICLGKRGSCRADPRMDGEPVLELEIRLIRESAWEDFGVGTTEAQSGGGQKFSEAGMSPSRFPVAISQMDRASGVGLVLAVNL